MPVNCEPGLSFPFLVRKLDKRSSWGHQGDDSRASKVSKRIFPEVEAVYSLFKVGSYEDLVLVSIGLNSTRQSLTSNIFYVAFGEAELAQHKINILQNLGQTACRQANQLHIDIAGNSADLEALCSQAMAAQRNVFSVSKGQAKRIVEGVSWYNCDAVDSATACRCQEQNHH